MPGPPNKLLLIQAASLGWDFVMSAPPGLSRFTFHKTRSIFPALTCPVQATMRTATPPSDHGMVANGLYFRDLKKPLFWEQAASLVEGGRVWESFRATGNKAGMMFWQQSLGEDLDYILSPKPVHKHRGGMIQDCYSSPHDLYAHLRRSSGRPFNLMHYWGPLASHKSTDWIVEAAGVIMTDHDYAPGLLMLYLPHLDYDLQRFGPASRQAGRSLTELMKMLDTLLEQAQEAGYDYLLYGDYAMAPVTRGAVFPNRALREAGLFRVRQVKNHTYPDFFSSPALAVVDHEVAHVYVQDTRRRDEVKDLMKGLPGVSDVLEKNDLKEWGVHHSNSGELVLVSSPGQWFAYPWWTNRSEAPDFASHVDIHNKPGYDPCELFFGFPPLGVSQNTTRVQGTHGRADDSRSVAWATSLTVDEAPENLIDLAKCVSLWLDQMS